MTLPFAKKRNANFASSPQRVVTVRVALYLECGCLSVGGGDGALDEVAVCSRVSAAAGLPAPLPPSASASPLMLETHHHVTTAPAMSARRTIAAT
ncbi:unnamed protein product, partial [Iphiclides podalirius]